MSGQIGLPPCPSFTAMLHPAAFAIRTFSAYQAVLRAAVAGLRVKIAVLTNHESAVLPRMS
jgi:hypothetical protein